MIKGVNRQMIEVTHTGSPYFERAFLVVRGGAVPTDEEKLNRIAEKVVEQAGSYAGLRRQRRNRALRQGLFVLLCGGLGAAAMWIVEKLA